MYISKSKTKKARRFQTKAIVACLKELEAAEKRRADSRIDTMRAVFARFADAGDLWARAVRCVATVDALCALAAVSNQHGYTRPAIVEEADATSQKTTEAAVAAPVVLDLQQVRHPCLVLPVGQEAIPNDTKLGGEEGHSGSTPRMLLLTGPNMGGKSTLLRCCCVVSIMAQLGCFVPGNEVRLSPIDRIFTRLGASDRILAGQSTFFVELSEAAAILHHATSRYTFVAVLYLPSPLALPHYIRAHTHSSLYLIELYVSIILCRIQIHGYSRRTWTRHIHFRRHGDSSLRRAPSRHAGALPGSLCNALPLACGGLERGWEPAFKACTAGAYGMHR